MSTDLHATEVGISPNPDGLEYCPMYKDPSHSAECIFCHTGFTLTATLAFLVDDDIVEQKHKTLRRFSTGLCSHVVADLDHRRDDSASLSKEDQIPTTTPTKCSHNSSTHDIF